MGCATERSGFLVLGTRESWELGRAFDLAISERGLALSERTEYAAATIGLRDLPAGAEAFDFAVGRCRQVFVLEAESAALRVYDPVLGRSEGVPCVDVLFERPEAIAFTPGILFLANRRGERRIVALTELDRQLLWTVGADEDAAGGSLGLSVPLLPVELAAGPGGRLHALAPLELAGPDRQTVPAGGRLGVAVFDWVGRLVRVLAPDGLALSAATGVEELGRSLALAVAPDGSVYVLESAGRRILRLSPDGELAGEIPVARPPAAGGESPAFLPTGLAVDRAGRLFVGDGRLGPIDEDDRFIHRFDPSGEHLGEVAGYRGQARALAADRDDRLYVHDPEGRRIVLLEPRSIFRAPTPGPPAGIYYSPPLDSTEPGTRWHRLRVEAEVPEHTRIALAYGTLEEPGRYRELLGDDELVPEERRRELERLVSWSPWLIEPEDAPILAARGRYLVLRVELVGTEEVSPRVRRVRAHFPHTSYLRYLPAAYQEDPAGREFLERFLGLFESLLEGLEEEIAGLVRILDADAVSRDFLAWLGSWLAVSADEGWPEDRLRTLVARAPELYRQRGTRAGIETVVEIFTGERPMIVEQFQLACARDREVRKLLERLYGSDPYCFCVLLRPGQVAGEEERRAVKRLVEAEKPAHTSAGVRVLDPFVVLDWHAYLEINSTLGEPEPRLDGGAALARDAVLWDTEEAGRVETRSRIDRDASLI